MTPIFFTVTSRCHPERSGCLAQRSSHAVEGPLWSSHRVPSCGSAKNLTSGRV